MVKAAFSVGVSMGVFGTADDGYAGFFRNNSPSGFPTLIAEAFNANDPFEADGDNGNCRIDSGGDVFCTGTINGSAKNFRLDHPLDPANKYLMHASVESSEMMNIYSGNVTTDAQGEAKGELPDWFEAENGDFRYQLTVIGQFAQAIVAREIQNHEFAIKTNLPNVKVSWQVTGVRQDAWAKAHPLVVEEEKEDKLRGYYIHPELYGAPSRSGGPNEACERSAGAANQAADLCTHPHASGSTPPSATHAGSRGAAMNATARRMVPETQDAQHRASVHRRKPLMVVVSDNEAHKRARLSNT